MKWLSSVKKLKIPAGSFSSVTVLQFIFCCRGISNAAEIRVWKKLTKEPPFKNSHSKREEFRTLKERFNPPISGKYVMFGRFGGFVMSYRCFALGFGSSSFTAVSSCHIVGSRFVLWRNHHLIPKRKWNPRFKIGQKGPLQKTVSLNKRVSNS